MALPAHSSEKSNSNPPSPINPPQEPRCADHLLTLARLTVLDWLAGPETETPTGGPCGKKASGYARRFPIYPKVRSAPGPCLLFSESRARVEREDLLARAEHGEALLLKDRLRRRGFDEGKEV